MAKKEYTEGGITYSNDGKNIYKNGNVVAQDNYKYIPTQVGGTRGQATTSTNGTGTGSRLEQFVTSNQVPTANYDSVKNISVSPDKYSWYSEMQNNAYDQYSAMQGDEKRRLEQYATEQKALLQQQLDANRAKYEAQYNAQVGSANSAYAQQNANIEKQTYANYDRANTQGSARGVATSGQQQAMNNSVAQYAIGLHNSNASNRDATLSSLYSKLMEQSAGLDAQYAEGSMGIDNALNSQMSSINQGLADNYLSQQNATASGLVSLTQNEMNRLSDIELQQIKSNLESEMSKYSALLQDASTYDQNQYDMNKLAKQQEYQEKLLAIQHQYSMAEMAQQASYARASSGGSSKKGKATVDEKGNPFVENIYGIKQSEFDAMVQAYYEYYSAQGYSPLEAVNATKAEFDRQFKIVPNVELKSDALNNGMMVMPDKTSGSTSRSSSSSSSSSTSNRTSGGAPSGSFIKSSTSNAGAVSIAKRISDLLGDSSDKRERRSAGRSF